MSAAERAAVERAADLLDLALDEPSRMADAVTAALIILSDLLTGREPVVAADGRAAA